MSDPDVFDLSTLKMSRRPGQQFKLLSAFCYETYLQEGENGFEAVWKMCELIQSVKVDSMSFLQSYLGQKKSEFHTGAVRDWEELHIPKGIESRAMHDDVWKDLGHYVHQIHRFNWSMYFTEGDVAGLYEWMVVIGKALLDLFLQQIIMITHPELYQTQINGLFDAKTKTAIRMDIALKLRLHKMAATKRGGPFQRCLLSMRTSET